MYDNAPVNSATTFLLVTGSTYQVLRGFSTTAGAWTVPAPSLSLWHGIGVSHDASSVSNVPSIYIDGIAATVTTVTPPVGSATTNNQAFSLGNRADGIRNWDGLLAWFVYWNIVLSADDHFRLGQGTNPLTVRPDAIVHAEFLDGISNPEPSWGNTLGFGTLTGTRFGQDNPIVMPPSIEWYDRAISVAAGGAFQPAWAQRSNILQSGGYAA